MKKRAIIIKPVITEKAAGKVQNQKFIFMVSRLANKKLIAEEVKKLYKVDPIKINIIRIPGETKLVRGQYQTKTKSYKKAIVTLKKGQKIEGFEG